MRSCLNRHTALWTLLFSIISGYQAIVGPSSTVNPFLQHIVTSHDTLTKPWLLTINLVPVYISRNADGKMATLNHLNRTHPLHTSCLTDGELPVLQTRSCSGHKEVMFEPLLATPLSAAGVFTATRPASIMMLLCQTTLILRSWAKCSCTHTQIPQSTGNQGSTNTHTKDWMEVAVYVVCSNSTRYNTVYTEW